MHFSIFVAMSSFLSSSSKEENNSMVSSRRRSLKASFPSFLVVVLAIFVQLGYCVTNAEYFSSVDSLKKLGDVEVRLLKAFHEYLQMKEKELESYYRFIGDIKEEHKSATDDMEDYISNPINGFKLINRRVISWESFAEHIKESPTKKAFNVTLNDINEDLRMPDDAELKGAVKGLLRLQKIDSLEAKDLIMGNINGIKTGTKLSWEESFEIAANLFDLKEFSYALAWLETTLDMLSEIESIEDPITRNYEIQALEYLVLTHHKLGNIDEMVESADEILKLSPNHHIQNLIDYLLNSSPPESPQWKPLD